MRLAGAGKCLEGEDQAGKQEAGDLCCSQQISPDLHPEALPALGPVSIWG